MAAALTSGVAHRGGSGFLAWWLGELGAMLPVRDQPVPRLVAFVVALHDGEILRFAICSKDQVEGLGALEPVPDGRTLDSRNDALLRRIVDSGLPIVLRLAPELGVFTTDVLPRAAKRDLRAIVTNRLDLLTPWPADKVRFATELLDRRPDGSLEVGIAVAPTGTVDAAVEALDRLDLEPAIVDLGDDDPFAPPVHDLLPRTGVRRLPGPLRALAMLLAVAAIGAGAFAFLELRNGRTQLEERRAFAAALERRLEDLPELRARIEGLEGETRTMVQRHFERRPTLATLELLSTLLPDTAWLETLTIDGRQVTLTGYSRDAATLLSLIEEDEAFEGTRFAAPSERVGQIVGGQQVEVDRFSLETQVQPERTAGF